MGYYGIRIRKQNEKHCGFCEFFDYAPVAQLDRAPDYGSGGLWFMSYGEPNKAPKNLII